MQKVPAPAPAALAALLAALAMILPAQGRAVTLDGPLLIPPVCLSASSPAPCHGGLPSTEVYEFDFNLSGVAGPGEIFTGATLRLMLSDDFGPGDGTEKINLVVGGVSVRYHADAGHDARIALPDLFIGDDGHLHVRLTASQGDFFFGGATLNVETGPGPTSFLNFSLLTNGDQGDNGTVPAPAPLLLLGLGLAALTWLRRARP